MMASNLLWRHALFKRTTIALEDNIG